MTNIKFMKYLILTITLILSFNSNSDESLNLKPGETSFEFTQRIKQELDNINGYLKLLAHRVKL